MSDQESIERQIKFARQVVDDLAENGHDVHTLDLLDALATTGLVLLPDIDHTMPGAYAALVARATPEG